MRILFIACLGLMLAAAPSSALVVAEQTPALPSAAVGWAYEGDAKRLTVTYTLPDGVTPAVPDLVEYFVRTKPGEILVYTGAPIAPASHIVPLAIPPAANRLLLSSWPEWHTITIVATFAGVQQPLVREYELIDVPGFVTDAAGTLVTPTAAPPTRTPLR